MRIAIMGSGAVGGYYGARLALAGHDVTFIARGAHLAAIRARGLQVRSPRSATSPCTRPRGGGHRRGRRRRRRRLAVKAYDNATAIPAIAAAARTAVDAC